MSRGAELEQRRRARRRARRARASASRRRSSRGSTIASAARTCAARPSSSTTTRWSAPGASGHPGDGARHRAVARARAPARRVEPERGLDGPAVVDVGRRPRGHERGARLAGGAAAATTSAAPPRSSRNVAGRWPSSGTRGEHAAELLEHEHRLERRRARRRRWPRTRAARASRPRPRSATGRAARAPSSASRAASTVFGARERAARGLLEELLLVGEGEVHRHRLLLARAQLGERDPLVQARLGRQAEHALADHVAQDLLRAAGGLQARHVGDELAEALVGEPGRAEHVADQVAGRDRRADRRHLRQRALRARDLARAAATVSIR